MLDGLTDDELRAAIARAQDLLKDRDRQRKDVALADAAAILAKAGLGLKDLARRSPRTRTKAQPAYKGGRQYQHPVNKALVWNAKGKKPQWLAALEAEGKSPVEVAHA
jgi:DNA-binding protein H-NS